MKRHWQYALLSTFIAVTLWYMVSGRERVDTWVEMRIEMTGMPADMVVLEGLQNKIKARIRGPKGRIRGLSDREFTYLLDLSQLKKGENVLPVTADNMPVKGVFQVVEISPPRLQLTVDMLVEHAVPVVPKPQGEPAVDVEISALKPVPDTVIVRGAQARVESVQEVPAIVSVSGITSGEDIRVSAAYALPPGVDVTPANGYVQVATRRLTHNLTLKRRIWLELPEGIAGKSHTLYVNVEVEVPASKKKDKEYLKGIRTVLEIPDTITSGKHTRTYRVDLPEGARLVQATPDTLEVTISGK